MQQNHQIAMSTQDYQALKDGIEAIQKQNETMSLQLLKLTIKVSGNELDRNDNGMIGELKQTKLEIIELKDDVAKIKTDRKSNRKYIAGFIAATTVFWVIIQFLFNNFFKH